MTVPELVVSTVLFYLLNKFTRTQRDM